MNVKLQRLEIENFKSFKRFSLGIDGDNATIAGENGSGKTTVYDAFLWLLFGKDSTGRKDFELRPLDKNNDPIKGLVLAVEACISFDGNFHVLRKEHHEKITKGKSNGYESQCWIDEVPKKVGEYSEWIVDAIPEDTFKLLTDLHQFNSKLHWTDRRKVLLDIAGEIGTPGGFDDLMAALNGRKIVEYKKVLTEQKKRYIKERDGINPRIDEINKGMEGYEQADEDALQKERETVTREIELLDKSRNDLLATEQQRQEKLTSINNLKAQKITRETLLKNDTTGVQHLLDEKVKLESGIASCQLVVLNAQSAIDAKDVEVRIATNDLDARKRELAGIQQEYATTEKKPIDCTCFTCGQQLPENKRAEVENKRTAALSEITQRGNKAMNAVTSAKQVIESKQAERAELHEQLEQAQIKLAEGEQYRDQRLPVIESQINNKETIKPENDLDWKTITAEIIKLEAEIGKPASDQVRAIEEARKIKANKLAELDKSLAPADRMKQDVVRIAELGGLEKDLAQKIADVEKQLADIDNYGAEQDRMLVAAVNDRFKHVEFKLFNTLLNGSIEPCCEATLNGVPYADMSCGQKIIVGVDIINVLSGHYGLSVPLFVDNAESLTLPLEANSQTVRLFAFEGFKKIEVITGDFEKEIYARRVAAHSLEASKQQRKEVA